MCIFFVIIPLLFFLFTCLYFVTVEVIAYDLIDMWIFWFLKCSFFQYLSYSCLIKSYVTGALPSNLVLSYVTRCKIGKHTTEKPVTKIVSSNTKKPIPAPVQPSAPNKNSDESCSRCRQGFFCSDHGMSFLT